MTIRLRALAALLALAAVPAMAGAQGDGRNLRTWRWDGPVEAGHWVGVHSINGEIRVTQSTDNLVHVVAEKRENNGGSIDEVTLLVAQEGGDVTFCAVWHDSGTCDISGYHQNRSRRNERTRTSVTFTVQVPQNLRVKAVTVNGAVSIRDVGAQIEVSTVNGSCEVSNASGPVKASTVNGAVNVTTATGAVNASTVNGKLNATMTALAGNEDLRFSTVNGSITIALPAAFSANVRFDTVNGGIGSEFPLTISGRIGPRHVSGTIGGGGRELRASTVNGSIDLKRAG